ncbi:MAG: NlpC/P60 family protein [Candidatus Berkelbacteria bacterium]
MANHLQNRFAPEYSALWQGCGDMCAVIFSRLELPISDEEALKILLERGFSINSFKLLSIARNRISSTIYQRGAALWDAPEILDCSSLIWWIYRQNGISLPRYSLNQRQASVDTGIWSEDDLENLQTGDLVFLKGRHPYYLTDEEDGVGHVGFATGQGTIIHAANGKRGVVEDSVEDFIGDWSNFRGAGRILPPNEKVMTLLAAPNHNITHSIDLRCIIFQKLAGE